MCSDRYREILNEEIRKHPDYVDGMNVNKIELDGRNLPVVHLSVPIRDDRMQIVEMGKILEAVKPAAKERLKTDEKTP